MSGSIPRVQGAEANPPLGYLPVLSIDEETFTQTEPSSVGR